MSGVRFTIRLWVRVRVSVRVRVRVRVRHLREISPAHCSPDPVWAMRVQFRDTHSTNPNLTLTLT